MEIIIKNFKWTYIHLYSAILIMTILFGRSFTGIFIFGYRIGEIAIGTAYLFLLYFFIFFKKENPFFVYGKQTFYSIKFIIISFFMTVFFTKGSLFDIYTYKSSSYIWTISFLILGGIFYSYIDKDFYLIKIFPLLLPLTYILSTIYFPQFLIDFFLKYSDKFDFLKAADVFLLYIFTNIFNQKNMKSKFNFYTYFLISSAIFIPLFLYKSKGAFLPATIFLFVEIIRTRQIFLNNKIKSLIVMTLCVPVFFLSTYNSGLGFAENEYTLEEERIYTIAASVSRAASEKNTTELFGSFFIYDGRLYSEEQMANWRLQIWQDVVLDLFSYSEYSADGESVYRASGDSRNDLVLNGFGYNEMLPAMDFGSRRGTDLMNENVHNFAINILAKGGFLQFFLFIFFYLSLITHWYKKKNNLRLLSFITFVLMCASFDVAMEGVRFPFIFFSSISYLFYEK
tara:strand:- start:7154 stop:8515 length:1362 start_codon:yes stop_codon:yes gene_type:complete